MEFADILRSLRARWYLVVIVFLAAGGGALAVKQRANAAPTGDATTQILVDSPQSALSDLGQDPGPLASRAAVFAQLMTSDAVVHSIAQAAGVPPYSITAEGPYSGVGQTLNVQTPSAARGAQLVASTAKYRLTFVAQAQLPVITVSVQAPTAEAAGLVANAVYPGVEAWLKTLTPSNAIQPSKLVTLRQLGNAQAGSISSSSATVMGAAAGGAIMVFGLFVIVGIDALVRRRRPARERFPVARSRDRLPLVDDIAVVDEPAFIEDVSAAQSDVLASVTRWIEAKSEGAATAKDGEIEEPNEPETPMTRPAVRSAGWRKHRASNSVPASDDHDREPAGGGDTRQHGAAPSLGARRREPAAENGTGDHVPAAGPPAPPQDTIGVFVDQLARAAQRHAAAPAE